MTRRIHTCHCSASKVPSGLDAGVDLLVQSYLGCSLSWSGARRRGITIVVAVKQCNVRRNVAEEVGARLFHQIGKKMIFVCLCFSTEL